MGVDANRPPEPITRRPIDWRLLILFSIPLIASTFLLLDALERVLLPDLTENAVRKVHLLRGAGLAFIFAVLAAVGIERNWRLSVRRMKTAEAAVMAAERERTQSERLASIGRLAAGVAHEIGNPLAAISGAVQRLQSKGWDEKAPQRLKVIEEQTARITEIVRRLGSLTAASFERQEHVRLPDVLLDAAKSLPPRSNLKIDVRVFPPDLTVEISPIALRQALAQICLNAFEAIGESGRIRIEAARENSRVSITVEDDGAGMTHETLARASDPFFTTKPMGTGLGLTVARSLVASMQGTLEIDSKPAKGTRVKMTLPRSFSSGVIG